MTREELDQHAERIARAYMDTAEQVGKDMTLLAGGEVRHDDTWGFDDLGMPERQGMLETLRRMIEHGVIIPGPRG